MSTGSVKKKAIIIAIILIVLALGFGYYQFFGSQEAQNRWARKRVTLLEGNYDVTYTDMGNVKTWQVRDGKVTSEPDKGYYFFWAQNPQGKEIYIQTPIARTYIEQVKD